MPHGDGRHYLVVKQEIRDQAAASAGDVVYVVMEKDTAPRVVALPQDFKRALKSNPKADKVFAAFSYIHQKEYVEWIKSAKKVETRARRIESAMGRILAKERLKG